MFGKNSIVGQKFFNDATEKNGQKSNELLVTSIFMTLQGEGPFAGLPALFVRLSKCNLACSFCDTDFERGTWKTIPEMEKAIDKVIKNYFNGIVPDWADRWPGKRREMVLVITGGEPMLQSNVVPFCDDMLTDAGFENIQIESNGIVVQEELDPDVYLVVSPKCAEKDGIATKYLEPHEKTLKRADCLKFVLSADAASPYHTVPRWAIDWARTYGKPIYVSPMNNYLRTPYETEVVSAWTPGLLDVTKNQETHEYAAKYCIQHGLQLSIQQHLYASVA
jgi:7-carboxy-7-deazaguanine synthase